VVNRSQGRLDHLREMVSGQVTDIEVVYLQNEDPLKNDAIMATFPPFSLVINATGMGKDTPGSPITDSGLFPEHGIAWEFNYRGELDFMHQALDQVDRRALRVEDGWLYFLHGWTQVVAQVLHIDLTPELFGRPGIGCRVRAECRLKISFSIRANPWRHFLRTFQTRMWYK